MRSPRRVGDGLLGPAGRVLVPASAALIGAGLVAGAVVGLAGVGSASDASPTTDAGAIFVHNARLGLVLLAGGATGGVLTALGLVGGGLLIGVVVGASLRLHGFTATAIGVAPHFVPEVLAFALCGAVGLALPYFMLERARSTDEGEARGAEVVRFVTRMVPTAFGLLFVGALIEATLTVYLLEEIA